MKTNRKRDYSKTISTSVTLFLLFLTFLLYRSFRQYDLENIQSDAEVEANSNQKLIELALDERIHSLERMAQHWKFKEKKYSQQDWLNDVQTYHEAFHSVEGSGWANSKSELQWVYPVKISKKLLHFQINSDPARKVAFELARTTEATALTHVMPLKIDATVGFGVYVPVFYENKFNGVMISAFNVKKLIQNTVKSSSYEIAVSEDGHEVFRNKDDGRESSEPPQAEVKFQYHGLAWKIQVTPRASFLANQLSVLPNITLAVGSAFSILIGLILHLYMLNRKAKERAWQDLNWQQAIVNGSDLSIISTNNKGLILSLNPSAEALTGYKANEVCIRETPLIWLEADDLKCLAERLTKKFGRPVAPGLEALTVGVTSGHVAKHEVIIVTKTGEKRIANVSVHALTDQGGQITGYVGILKDTTEKIRQQKQLREQQIKMIQSSKFAALGEMATGAAHEINNPLSVISGKSFRIRKLIEKKIFTEEVVISDLLVIEETTHRIAKIIKGLRSFARDSDKDPFAPISIHHIVEQTLSLCQERFTFNGVSLRVQKTQENLTILSRSYQISQVLLNLLNNAFDAASESVEKWVEIEIRRDSNEVCIIVSDSGSGVPVLLQDKIMQPFFTTKPVGRGTGLGLSIALGIVTDHKGTLSLKSLPGGASFEINLPLFHGAASS